MRKSRVDRVIGDEGRNRSLKTGSDGGFILDRLSLRYLCRSSAFNWI